MADFFMINAPEILHTSLEEAKTLSIIYYCQNVVSTCYGISNDFYKIIWKPKKEKLCQDICKTQDCLYMYNQFMSSVIDLSDNQHLCTSLYNLLTYLAEKIYKDYPG